MIERDGLVEHVRGVGDWMRGELERWVQEYPRVVRSARGLGFMQGIELQAREEIPGFASTDRPASLQMVNRLHEAGVLTIPSGNQVVRFLPALNLRRETLAEGLATVEKILREVG